MKDFEKIKLQILSVDTVNLEQTVVKVQFSWKFWFKTKILTEYFYTNDMVNYFHVHTGKIAHNWWDNYYNSWSDGVKFERWLKGEVFLIKTIIHSSFDIKDDIIGKIFKSKKEQSLDCIPKNKVSFKKDECFTVVDIKTAVNQNRYYIPFFYILFNNVKYAVYNIPDSFELCS